MIATVEIYHASVENPLLDIGRIAFVPHLVTMGAWHQCRCAQCASVYIAPMTDLERVCAGCRLYYRYRCTQCGAALNATPHGRPRAHCPQCGAHIHRGVH